jgi:hypothetical protein
MENFDRAAEALIDSHGRSAGPVAEKRAINAKLGGSFEAADLWRQIAGAIRTKRTRL